MDSPPLTLKREPMPLTALTHFLARSLAHLLAHSCSYSLTQSLTLSLTCSLSSPMCFSDAEGVSPAVEAVQAMCSTTRGTVLCVLCVLCSVPFKHTFNPNPRGPGGRGGVSAGPHRHWSPNLAAWLFLYLKLSPHCKSKSWSHIRKNIKAFYSHLLR